MWLCDGDKLGEQSPFSVIMSEDPRPIKEILGYDPFEGEIWQRIMITVKKLDSDFDNGFHFDTIGGFEVGSLLRIDGHFDEVVRVRVTSTIDGEQFLMFDRGYGNTPISEIKVGTQLILIGWEEPKDLYPLTVTTVTKDGN